MSTKLRVLETLKEKSPAYISGQDLANELNLSRNSIWKAIKRLQEDGFAIDTKPSIGYRLLDSADVLSAAVLTDSITKPCKVHVFDTIDSTNSYAKALDCNGLVNVVVANEQTKGRGRLGRHFYSPSSKGIYMTIAFEPDFGIDKAMLITSLTAVAVCKSFEEVVGVGPKIKWVNDIYIQEKKVCGILTEAESNFETGTISKIIVGIGINCFEQEFPDDIKDRATYITNPQKEYERNQLIAAITNKFFELVDNFDKIKLLRDYKSRSMILGQPILIYGTNHSALPENGGRGVKARAIDIDENGGLVVEYLEGMMSHQMETITSGEVTIRKDYY
ncbi:MAG: biotin--[Firmicutes bacterium]|nr:biotin--[acetyl-CoA-carboxylase] ligase [Bacillota bacterium]